MAKLKLIKFQRKTPEIQGKLEQKAESRATNTAILFYLNNPPLLSTLLGKYASKKLVMDQSFHTNRSWLETTLLTIITKSLGPVVFVVGGLQPFGDYGAHLDETTFPSLIIHSNQATPTIDIW